MIAMFGLLLLACSAAVTNAGPVIDAPCGRLEGRTETLSDGRVTYNFLGVPFARPPVGSLRFRAPERLPPWPGTRDATRYGPGCVQDPAVWRSLVGDWLYDTYIGSLPYSEDCLTLNIFTPEDAVERGPLPVMVWIHGGAWQTGTSAFKLYAGDSLAATGDVIVVSANHRVGPFGFLTTGNDVIPGNAGLYDQLMTLEWVRDNIAAFGGDPEKVTLFGESTGAASIAFHTLSPLSAGLFQRAIAQSGNAFRLTATPAAIAATTTTTLIENLGCVNEGDLERQVDCLRRVPAEALLSAASSAGRITPVIEGRFIPDNPDNLWKSGRFNKVDYMIGTNTNEASLFLPDRSVYDVGMSSEDAFLNAAIASSITGYPNLEVVTAAVVAEHFPDLSDPFSNLRGTIEMFRGLFYEAPKALTLRGLKSAGCKAYEYRFSRRPSYYPTFTYDTGAWHADEMAFVFGAVGEDGILAKNATREEKELSRSMMRAWLTFAKTGTPFYTTSEGTDLQWPEFDLEEKRYLDFELEMSSQSQKRELHERENGFWNDFLPIIGG